MNQNNENNIISVKKENNLLLNQNNGNYMNKNNIENDISVKQNNKNYNDIIHKHPLSYCTNLLDCCQLCSKNISNNPGYKCNYCEIILCLECYNKIFKIKKYGKLKNHNIELIYLENWECFYCKKNFQNKICIYFKGSNLKECDKCLYSYIEAKNYKDSINDIKKMEKVFDSLDTIFGTIYDILK